MISKQEEDEKTSFSKKDVQNSASIIRGSQRPDGSFRKDIKIRAGYVNMFDVERYTIPQRRPLRGKARNSETTSSQSITQKDSGQINSIPQQSQKLNEEAKIKQTIQKAATPLNCSEQFPDFKDEDRQGNNDKGTKMNQIQFDQQNQDSQKSNLKYSQENQEQKIVDKKDTTELQDNKREHQVREKVDSDIFQRIEIPKVQKNEIVTKQREIESIHQEQHNRACISQELCQINYKNENILNMLKHLNLGEQ